MNHLLDTTTAQQQINVKTDKKKTKKWHKKLKVNQHEAIARLCVA